MAPDIEQPSIASPPGALSRLRTFWRTSRKIRIAVVLSIATVFALLTQIEHWRAEASAIEPAAAAGAVHVDADRLLADVRFLASPELAGRRTGSPGAERARAFVGERLAAVTAPLAGQRSQTFAVRPRRPRQGETPNLQGTNVFGVIPGTVFRDRYLLLTAHYDHLGVRDGELHPGADDNASGVATLLAAAAHFAAHPPRHSLLFVAFDAEELGLAGSEAFVAAPPVPREQMLATINLDMVSRSEAREIYVAGTWHRPFLRPPVELVARRNGVRVLFGHDRPLLPGGFADDWTGQSDHAPFHEVGIPFLYFGVEDHADYHQPGDTADKIDPTFFAAVAGLVIDTLAHFDQQLDTILQESAG